MNLRINDLSLNLVLSLYLVLWSRVGEAESAMAPVEEGANPVLHAGGEVSATVEIATAANGLGEGGIRMDNISERLETHTRSHG